KQSIVPRGQYGLLRRYAPRNDEAARVSGCLTIEYGSEARAFPSLLVGEGGSPERSGGETGEGCGSAGAYPSSGALHAPPSPTRGEGSTALVARDSRRFPEPGIEMLQPRQHLVLEQRERVMPGLRLVLVVEAEHQEHAEAADLVPDLLDLLGHRLR